MALAPTVLSQLVERGMGAAIDSAEGQDKLLRALLDIHSHPLLTPEEAARARAALEGAPS